MKMMEMCNLDKLEEMFVHQELTEQVSKHIIITDIECIILYILNTTIMYQLHLPFICYYGILLRIKTIEYDYIIYITTLDKTLAYTRITKSRETKNYFIKTRNFSTLRPFKLFLSS